MKHITDRLYERHIQLTEAQIIGLCYEYDEDTAVILKKCSFHGIAESNQSNGELVILIVRNNHPVTVMYRRLNQPTTAGSMNVSKVIDLSKILQ